MQQLNLKPNHAPVRAYYKALGQYGQLHFDHEMAVRSAFQNLLEKCGSQFSWTLIAEYPLPRPKAAPLKVDGALVDEFRLKRGLWEAKDEHDDLEKEAKRKISAGYPIRRRRRGEAIAGLSRNPESHRFRGRTCGPARHVLQRQRSGRAGPDAAADVAWARGRRSVQ